MPELPDIEEFKKEAGKALNFPIKDVIISDRKFIDISNHDIKKYLIGNKFIEVLRKGKNLFLTMENNYNIALHFGMTGFLKYSHRKEEEEKYSKCIFELDNDHRLTYVSRRKLGSLKIVSDIGDYISKLNLGPDALEIKEKDFLKKQQSSSTMIKAFLTDQSLLSGIGNIYSDEILFQSRIHPQQKALKISETQGKTIFKNIKEVLNKAIEQNADVTKLPSNFLLSRRKEGEKCPRCKAKIKKIKVSGRSGYYCPECQKLNQ